MAFSGEMSAIRNWLLDIERAHDELGRLADARKVLIGQLLTALQTIASDTEWAFPPTDTKIADHYYRNCHAMQDIAKHAIAKFEGASS